MKDIALCTKTVAQKLLVGFSSQSTGEVTPQKLIVLRKASVVRASAARTQRYKSTGDPDVVVF
ncbi:MAG: hypothetical protein WAN68_10030, partial [Pseudolabrys sp.]